MPSHRPKSLSELNNVYDKALRAEKAIKEGSSLLSTPDNSTSTPNENIFAQLENKAAEAQRNQVFDPDITNIANNFLKRYAQPEKPKPAPAEIKRPAPSIQSVQSHVRKSKPAAKADMPLNHSGSAPLGDRSQSAPLHRPAHDVPATDTFATVPQTIVSAQATVPAYAESTAEIPAPQTPAVEAPAIKQSAVRTSPAPRIDHTPRPAPSRVRITSSERSELMEEYMRVMSDDDDEPTQKKSVFSFFRKKKHEDYDDEPVESIYEDLDEEESAPDEVPVVAFDSSSVKYEDEYSDSPVTEDEAVAPSSMNLYDYIEADFDYDEDEDGTLDVSTTTFEKETVETEEHYDETNNRTAEISVEIAESPLYPAEEASENPEQAEEPETAEDEPVETVEESPENEEVAETEDFTATEEVVEAEEIIEAQEDIAETEEALSDEVYGEESADTLEENGDYAPPADMEFEDIFSVSDESKRSHTGGDWGGTVPTETLPSYESDEAYSKDDAVYDSYDEYDEEAYDYDEEEEYYEKKKSNVFLKVILIFFALVSLSLAAATTAADLLLDIDSGKLISDNYRLFCADENMSSFDIAKGDLILTENIYAHKDDVYVYVNSDDNTYGVGRVTSNTSNPIGEYIYVTENETDTMLINRDMSMGVVVASYSTLGSILSIVCSYGIFITIAFALIAIGLIVLLIVISKKKADPSVTYTEDDASQSRDTDEDTDNGDSDDSEDFDDDEEYYSEYDTDGIEQGLFSDI